MPVTLALPAVWKMILYVVAAAVGVFAMWYFRKTLLPWIQAFYNKAETDENTAARTEVAGADQKDNADSDALKKIEGR